jgi:hypothetical protein
MNMLEHCCANALGLAIFAIARIVIGKMNQIRSLPDFELERRLYRQIPNFMKAVWRASVEDTSVLMSRSAFADDPRLLADALRFARESGVELQFVDDDKTRRNIAA